MFSITTITRVGLVAAVCVAVAAPQALAKSPIKGGKAKVVKVQSVKKASSDSAGLRADLSTSYAQGCQNGTVSDRTMGGDNNNYEYYGDVCTVSVPASPSLAVVGASGQTATTPTAGPAASDTNTNYEYYGGTNG